MKFQLLIYFLTTFQNKNTPQMNRYYTTIFFIFVIVSTALLSLSRNISDNNKDHNEKGSIDITELQTQSIDKQAPKVKTPKNNILNHHQVHYGLDSESSYKLTIPNTKVFRASDIASPTPLPEYLLNTPFLTLDMYSVELDELNEGDEFAIPIFPNKDLIVVISSRKNTSNFSILEGVLKSSDIHFPASFTYRDNNIFGTITAPEGEYRLSKISGVHVIYKIPELTSAPDNDALIFVPQTNY
jgi:hypothetical protein